MPAESSALKYRTLGFEKPLRPLLLLLCALCLASLGGCGRSGSSERVTLPPKDEHDFASTVELVESLMGRKPELRYAFIQEKARFVRDLDV